MSNFILTEPDIIQILVWFFIVVFPVSMILGVFRRIFY